MLLFDIIPNSCAWAHVRWRCCRSHSQYITLIILTIGWQKLSLVLMVFYKYKYMRKRVLFPKYNICSGEFLFSSAISFSEFLLIPQPQEPIIQIIQFPFPLNKQETDWRKAVSCRIGFNNIPTNVFITITARIYFIEDPLNIKALVILCESLWQRIKLLAK